MTDVGLSMGQIMMYLDEVKLTEREKEVIANIIVKNNIEIEEYIEHKIRQLKNQ